MLKKWKGLGVLLLLVLFWTGCGGSDDGGIPTTEIDDSDCNFIGQEIIKESPSGNPPAWVQDRPWRGVDSVGGETYVYFYAEGRSKQKNLAERSARGNVAAAAAESITKNVLSQFAEAIESWGDAEDEQIEQVRTSLVAFKSRVKVSGAIDMGTYSYQVEKVGGLQADGCTKDPSQSTTLWVSVIRQGISYTDYQRLREQAFDYARNQSEEDKEVGNLISFAENNIDRQGDSFEGDETGEALPQEWEESIEAERAPRHSTTAATYVDADAVPVTEEIELEPQSFYIRNETGSDIYYIYVSLSSSEEWNDEDILGSMILENGETYEAYLPEIDECFYDIKVEDEEGRVYFAWEKDLCDGAQIAISSENLSDEGLQDVYVTNNTGAGLAELYMVPSTIQDWEEDIMEGDILSNRNTMQVQIAVYNEQCEWDFKMVDSNGKIYYLWNQEICSNPQVTFTSQNLYGLDNVIIENQTGYDIQALYLVPVNMYDWEEDILEGDILYDGNAVQVQFEIYQDKCQWKIQGVDVDGDFYLIPSANLCEFPKQTLTFEDFDLGRELDSIDIADAANIPESIVIQNRTGYTLQKIVAWPQNPASYPAEDTWTGTVYDGLNVTVNITPNGTDCYWNFMAIDEDGDSYYIFQANICIQDVLTLTFANYSAK
jgi:hypothetical protein